MKTSIIAVLHTMRLPNTPRSQIRRHPSPRQNLGATAMLRFQPIPQSQPYQKKNHTIQIVDAVAKMLYELIAIVSSDISHVQHVQSTNLSFSLPTGPAGQPHRGKRVRLHINIPPTNQHASILLLSLSIQLTANLTKKTESPKPSAPSSSRTAASSAASPTGASSPSPSQSPSTR